MTAFKTHLGKCPVRLVRDYGEAERPARIDLLETFLDSLPAEARSGIAPTGYQYREYKNATSSAVACATRRELWRTGE